ncbi:MAG: PAS domain-containing protein [Wenzhouxiangella sp.]
MPQKTRQGPQQLRRDAEGRLLDGTTPSTAGWTISPEALSLLYRLSSDPDNPGDALKLLHELQTHQVELDLQHAQLEETELELSSQLAHYQALYQMAPAAYLLLGLDGRILLANAAASDLFELEAEALKGRWLTELLSSESRPAVSALLKSPLGSTRGQVLQVATRSSQSLRLLVAPAPQDPALLMLVYPEIETVTP